MNYYKLRYTLAPWDLEDLESFYRNINYEWFAIMRPELFTIGLEDKNMFGEPTHPHIHIHFTSDKKIKNIRDCLVKLWRSDVRENRQRASLYSLVEEADVKNDNYFFRYVYKQGGMVKHAWRDTTYCKIKAIPGFDVAQEQLLAMEQYSQVVEVNNKKREKQTQKDSTFDRICVFLEAYPGEPASDEADICLRIAEFYVQEGLACNTSTMAGYAVTYCVKVGILDKSYLVKKMMALIAR